MDTVVTFNAELSGLYETRPPISKAKMAAISRSALKAIKFYKHVVQSVEKFIQKCKAEYKVPGLYVIDSIVRQSRQQFGNDKDVFGPRFARNMQPTFLHLFRCSADDKSRIIRVLNLWQKNNVFLPNVIQPLFDLADPNHPLHLQYQQQHPQPQQQQQHQQQQHQHNHQYPPHDSSTNGMSSSNARDDSPPPTMLDDHMTMCSFSGSNSNISKVLNDPALMRQLNEFQNNKKQLDEKQSKLLELRKQEEAFEQHLTTVITKLPFASECDLSHRPAHNSTEFNASVAPPSAPSASQANAGGDSAPFASHPNQPPYAAYNSAAGQPITISDNSPPPSASIPIIQLDPEVELISDTEQSKVEVITLDGNSRSPTPERSGASDRHSKRRRSRSRDRSRRAATGSGRRSRSRSPSRSQRSSRRSAGGRHGSRDRQSAHGKDRERDRERRRRGLPDVRKDHLSVCTTTLWVGHLSKLVHQEELSDTFSKYGDIVSIDMIHPRGCAYIAMNRRQDACRAIDALRGHKMQGRQIIISWAAGKGVKSKEWKDYWDLDLGVTYVPWSKLSPHTDFDALEEGGMFDDETLPDWMREPPSAGGGTAPNALPPAAIGAPPPAMFAGADTTQPPPVGALAPPSAAAAAAVAAHMAALHSSQPPPSMLVNQFMRHHPHHHPSMHLPGGIAAPPPQLLLTMPPMTALGGDGAGLAAVAAQQQHLDKPPPPPPSVGGPPPAAFMAAAMNAAHHHHHHFGQFPGLLQHMQAAAAAQAAMAQAGAVAAASAASDATLDDHMDIEMDDEASGDAAAEQAPLAVMPAMLFNRPPPNFHDENAMAVVPPPPPLFANAAPMPDVYGRDQHRHHRDAGGPDFRDGGRGRPFGGRRGAGESRWLAKNDGGRSPGRGRGRARESAERGQLLDRLRERPDGDEPLDGGAAPHQLMDGRGFANDGAADFDYGGDKRAFGRRGMPAQRDQHFNDVDRPAGPSGGGGNSNNPFAVRRGGGPQQSFGGPRGRDGQMFGMRGAGPRGGSGGAAYDNRPFGNDRSNPFDGGRGPRNRAGWNDRRPSPGHRSRSTERNGDAMPPAGQNGRWLPKAPHDQPNDANALPVSANSPHGSIVSDEETWDTLDNEASQSEAANGQFDDDVPTNDGRHCADQNGVGTPLYDEDEQQQQQQQDHAGDDDGFDGGQRRQPNGAFDDYEYDERNGGALANDADALDEQSDDGEPIGEPDYDFAATNDDAGDDGQTELSD